MTQEGSSSEGNVKSGKQIVEEISKLKDSLTEINSTNLPEEHLEKAKEAVQSLACYHFVNHMFLSSLDISCSLFNNSQNLQTNNENGHESNLKDETFSDFILVLTEWYKLNHPTLQSVLLKHLPVLLFILLNGQRNPLAIGALLCIYNWEVLNRKQVLKKKQHTTSFLFRTHHLSSIDPSCIYLNEGISLPVVLTKESLTSHNQKTSTMITGEANSETQQQEFVFPKADFKKPDFIKDLKAESMSRLIRICTQVYEKRIAIIGNESLEHFCILCRESLLQAFPFKVPSHPQLLSMVRLEKLGTSKSASTNPSTNDKDNVNHDEKNENNKDENGDAGNNVKSNEGRQQIELDEIEIDEKQEEKGKQVEKKTADSNSIELIHLKLNAADNLLEVIDAFISQVHHTDPLDHHENQKSETNPPSATNLSTTMTASVTSKKFHRIVLGKTVLNQFLSLLSYACFALPTKSRISAYDALNVIHVRANYSLDEQLLLHTQAILSQIQLS